MSSLNTKRKDYNPGKSNQTKRCTFPSYQQRQFRAEKAKCYMSLFKPTVVNVLCLVFCVIGLPTKC